MVQCFREKKMCLSFKAVVYSEVPLSNFCLAFHVWEDPGTWWGMPYINLNFVNPIGCSPLSLATLQWWIDDGLRSSHLSDHLPAIKERPRAVEWPKKLPSQLKHQDAIIGLNAWQGWIHFLLGIPPKTWNACFSWSTGAQAFWWLGVPCHKVNACQKRLKYLLKPCLTPAPSMGTEQALAAIVTKHLAILTAALSCSRIV